MSFISAHGFRLLKVEFRLKERKLMIFEHVMTWFVPILLGNFCCSPVGVWSNFLWLWQLWPIFAFLSNFWDKSWSRVQIKHEKVNSFIENLNLCEFLKFLSSRLFDIITDNRLKWRMRHRQNNYVFCFVGLKNLQYENSIQGETVITRLGRDGQIWSRRSWD